MPTPQEIMHAIQESFACPPSERGTDDAWTKTLLTRLCKLGRNQFKFRCEVCASKGKVEKSCRDWGEWLYDITWLKYDENRLLVDVPLVGECEWGGLRKIEDDFQKLLLARAGIRLMIYNGDFPPGSEAIAKRLAENVRRFRYRRKEDAWFLVAWERAANQHRFIFRYFTIDSDGGVAKSR